MELLSAPADSPQTEVVDSSRSYAAPMAVGIAAVAFVLVAGGWYARRRWLR